LPDRVDGDEWKDAGHVARYLEATMPGFPVVAATHTDVLRELISPETRRVLDLGCGNGRLLSLALDLAPDATGVGIDFSEPMLDLARTRFGDDPRVQLTSHDLGIPLPDLGTFDLVISGFAIHHVADARKRAIYTEVFSLLSPGGMFINVEHVASPTERLHRAFLDALHVASEDPSNQLTPVETQLTWLREIGFADVDCLWKWREMALLAGVRPSAQ
jgi:tRNA (cmo5U34)-methyltransferase